MNESANTLNLLLKSIHPKLAIDNDGTCLIHFGSNLKGIVALVDQHVWIYMHLIATATATKQLPELFQKALTLNCFQVETKEGSLALSPMGEALLYACSIALEGLDEVGFHHFLSNVEQVSLNLQDKLCAGLIPQPEGQPL